MAIDNELVDILRKIETNPDPVDKTFPIERFYRAPNYLAKLKVIASYYKANEEDIINFNTKSPRTWHNTYPIDWTYFFTPAELAVWHDIRQHGVILYPQYPALGFHLDFGNPTLKIGLEVDGFEFHQDKAKDIRRDKELLAAGWKIYRVTGSEANRCDFKTSIMCEDSGYSEDYSYQAVTDWMMNTSNGVVRAIKGKYFETCEGWKYYPLIEASLESHCYTNPIS